MSVHEMDEVEGAEEQARPQLQIAYAGGGDD
jgi:hypothetical protein